MCPFSREFLIVSKAQEYSDLLEDTEWNERLNLNLLTSCYSDLLEDTEWYQRGICMQE